jgi:DNA primase
MMTPAKKTHQPGKLNRAVLKANPRAYYISQGMKLIGGGEWVNAVCPFHKDTNPSLRINTKTGAYRCFVCGARGGDILAFHQHKHGIGFFEAAKELGALEILT